MAMMRIPTPFALTNPTTGLLLPVAEGRNVIGRSAVPCGDYGFINLDSPRSAISRLHAVIDIAPNHDAWISDCRSTNGTVLAIGSGNGIILDPERFYQLTPGAKVTVGDVELYFVTHSGFKEAPAPPPATSQQPALIRARSKSALSRQGSQNSAMSKPVSAQDVTADQQPVARISASAAQGIIDAMSVVPAKCPSTIESSADLKASSLVAAIQQLQEGAASRVSTNGPKSSSRPYLDDSPTEMFVTKDDPPPKLGKKPREEAVKSPTAGHPKAKAARVEKEKPQSAPQAAPVKLVDRRRLCVCLSGMDSAEKQAISKSILALGGKVVDEIKEATLLVVKSPPPRTPKFIIAVGNGIPIVTPKYFEDGAPESFAPYVPELSHGNRRYSSKELAKVIFTNAARSAPVLSGKTFNVQQLPAKARPTVSDIIRACGGSLSTKKKEGADATVLTDDAEDVYDSILSGNSC